ncbi:Tautomerase/MIF superfamily [Mycena leptocephala]|nr:Tautomerase/MIF superfamily [Mycena leptocephala]
MPYLELMVNVQIPNETEFALEFSKVGAKALGKPEAYITTSITFNKTSPLREPWSLPLRSASCVSLDNINPEANEKYSAILSEFFQSKLGIPNDRGYIYKGTTFATIFGK